MSVHREGVDIRPSWVNQINWNPSLRTVFNRFSSLHSLNVCFHLFTFAHANGLIVGFVHWNDIKRCGGLVNRCVDVLVSLPQEDRLRKASPSCSNLCRAYFTPRTDSIITTLMAYSVNSGLATTWVPLLLWSVAQNWRTQHPCWYHGDHREDFLTRLFLSKLSYLILWLVPSFAFISDLAGR